MILLFFSHAKTSICSPRMDLLKMFHFFRRRDRPRMKFTYRTVQDNPSFSRFLGPQHRAQLFERVVHRVRIFGRRDLAAAILVMIRRPRTHALFRERQP